MGYLYDQTQRLPQLDPGTDEDEFCYLYSHQSFLAYLLEEPDQAAELMSQISPNFIAKQSSINAAYLSWLNSLIHLAIYPQCSPKVQTQIWQEIQKNQRKIRSISKSGDTYFFSKLKLIEAERYRVQEKHAKALEAYDQAIQYAQADSLLLDLAISCELAGKFYLTWGKNKIASVYFTDAYYAYSHWGAQIKVDHLETHYSQYLLPILYQKTPENTPLEDLDSGTETVTSTHNSQPGVLDLETIMKASQVLSEHLHLPQLISTLIQVILENAGAETCVLILRKQEQFVIESVARSQNNTLCVTSFLESKPWETETKIPQLLIQSVIDNKVPIIIDDVRRQIQRLLYENEAIPSYWHDPYWQTPGLQSILCTPIQYQGQLIGVLYLENNLMAGVFTPDRLGILQFLCSQAAISLENAQLYEKLENYSQDLAQTVAEQTQALRQEIYERKLLEEKLRSSENKMRASFEAMNDIILVLDSEASNIEVTPTHATRLNQGDIDLVSRTVEQFFLEDSSIWLGKVQEALTTNQIINFDYYLNINHECLWFSANISPLPDQTVMWVARDITDRKQAEEGIRHSEEKFASAFRASPSPMTITSLATGQHLEVNDSFLEIMGYEQEEVIGKTALELNFWVNFSDRNRLFELLQTERMIRNYEFEFCTKSGTIRTALLSAEVVRIQDQECLLSISNDITERKQREEAIRLIAEVGRGTLFKFAIQVGCASASDIPPSTPRRRVISLAPDQPTYRILVVEDRWESRVLLVNLLSSLGFSVQAAENGQEGVKIWEEWEPHLIWMDMRMPVMDGYAATQAIKSHLKGQATVIIALTASAMEEHRITVLSAGCDDFVRKPFREEVLFDKMAEYLGVQYIYDEEAGAQLNENTSSEPEEVTPATFAKMPASWTEKLYQAAQEADGKAILQLVAESPEIETHLGQTLIVWVNDFRFDKITDVIEQGNHESSFS